MGSLALRDENKYNVLNLTKKERNIVKSKILKSAVTVLITTLVCFGISFLFKPEYTSKTTFIKDGNSNIGVLLKSDIVADQVLESITDLKNYLEPSEKTPAGYRTALKKRISIKSPTSADTPTVLTVKLSDAGKAAEVANTYLKKAIESMKNLKLNSFNNKSLKIESKYVKKIQFTENSRITIIDKAEIPDKPSHPKRPLFIVIGMLIGVLIALPKFLLPKDNNQEHNKDIEPNKKQA